MADMTREFGHFWEGLFHGGVELFTLFLILFVVLTAWAWARNRRFRPAERGPNTPWLLLLIAFALVLVLRTFHGSWPEAATISIALLLAGFIGKTIREGVLWLPAILLATLMGLGWMLSAMVLALVGVLVLLIGVRGT